MITPDSLPLAVRVYPVPDGGKARKRRSPQPQLRRPKTMFVFDTETRTDAAQGLMFGCYRFYEGTKCLEEGLFYSDDLAMDELERLRRYADSHAAGTDRKLGVAKLLLQTRSEFLEKLYSAAFDGRSLLVGFNLPFDLARVATWAGSARGRFNGGFSFALWHYIDSNGKPQENRFRPRVVVKHVDSKRALKAFTSSREPDPEDQIPEGSEDGQPNARYGFRGHFLDLRTLAFALTDRGFSLDSACTAFGVENGKTQAKEHGIISDEYISYNRRDVQATSELAFKLLEEFDRHPIALQETKAYSPASIGKAYLRAMGVRPILERQPNFPKRYLGYAQSAFYGGRTSAHIRKVPVPVVYCDFLSMYPTVNALMGLWRFVVAKEIRVRKASVKELQSLLESVDVGSCFDPKTWTLFPVFVRIMPDGDVLPSRATYNAATNDWQVAVNHLYSASNTEPKDGLWYALPDLITSKLLTGKIPRIIEAFRIEPHGQLPCIQPTSLRGVMAIDPGTQDFFRTVIEERKRTARRDDLSATERNTQDKFLKVLANATSYGIFAQMDAREDDKPIWVTCSGIDPKPYRCRVAHAEEPGTYCFPPLASLITAAARLMLGLLERYVTDLGGTYAMEDTDSMAIVATKRGGAVSCPGGASRIRGREEAVHALSWGQVNGIVKRFEQLKPYDVDAIPGSILKIEDDNFDPRTRKQRELWCLAISAKRYALFLRDANGEPELLRKDVNNGTDRWSEHGLGHLLNPTDPGAEDRSWVGTAWLAMIRRSLRLKTKALGFEKRVAVGRVSVSSPAVLRPLFSLNAGKDYNRKIKPFNFVLSCYVRAFGHPVGADPDRFHLLAPYETNALKWSTLKWIDQYSGKRYEITTAGSHGTRTMTRVKNYGNVLHEYEYHAESKCAGSDGVASTKQTVGLLQRRHVSISSLRFIGKESNHLEEVEEGVGVRSNAPPYTDYTDLRRDEWVEKVLPWLKGMPLGELTRRSGMSRAALQAIRAGRRPHKRNAEILHRTSKDFKRKKV